MSNVERNTRHLRGIWLFMICPITALIGQIRVPYLALDSVCKPLVSMDQFDQRALDLKR